MYRNSEFTYAAMQNNPWWSKKSGVSPSSPTKPIGWVPINSVSTTTSFSRACAHPALLHFSLSQPSHSPTIGAQRTNEIQGLTQKNVGDFPKNVGHFLKNVGHFREKLRVFLSPSHTPKKHCNLPQLLRLLTRLLFHPFFLSYGVFSPIFHAILRETLKRCL